MSIVSRFFIVGLMGVSYIDSTILFFNLFGLCYKLFAMLFLLLAAFVIVFLWKNGLSEKVPSAKWYLILIRVILYAAMLLPLFFDDKWNLIDFRTESNHHLVLVGIEFVKVVIIELLLEVYFLIIIKPRTDNLANSSQEPGSSVA